MNGELLYLALIFGLLVVPRWLQRFKLPAPITCLALGIAAMLLWGDRVHDPVIVLLSTIGISSLFLFAGLERACHDAGIQLADVCKVQVFLDDMVSLAPMLDRWRRAFPQAPPALSAVATGGPAPLLAPGAHVQLDAIAYAPRR